MLIFKANRADLAEILQLQYLAYQSEAKLLKNFAIPPLTQTLQDVSHEYDRGVILKISDDNNKIIATVRGYSENGLLYIGKLCVHPSWQGKGLATRLLKEIELYFPNHSCQLFTSSKSVKNLQLYEHIGYKIKKEEKISPELTLIYLEK